MAFFTAPTVAEIQDEVKLRPEQVRATFTAQNYIDDVTDRIVEETAYVQVRIGGTYTEDELSELSADHLALATKATELRVAASLYHSAGQLNEAYKKEALDYERRANEILELLSGIVGTVLGGVDAVANGAATLSTAAYYLDVAGLPVVNGSYYD